METKPEMSCRKRAPLGIKPAQCDELKVDFQQRLT